MEGLGALHIPLDLGREHLGVETDVESTVWNLSFLENDITSNETFTVEYRSHLSACTLAVIIHSQQLHVYQSQDSVTSGMGKKGETRIRKLPPSPDLLFEIQKHHMPAHILTAAIPTQLPFTWQTILRARFLVVGSRQNSEGLTAPH